MVPPASHRLYGEQGNLRVPSVVRSTLSSRAAARPTAKVMHAANGHTAKSRIGAGHVAVFGLLEGEGPVGPPKLHLHWVRSCNLNSHVWRTALQKYSPCYSFQFYRGGLCLLARTAMAGTLCLPILPAWGVQLRSTLALMVLRPQKTPPAPAGQTLQHTAAVALSSALGPRKR